GHGLLPRGKRTLGVIAAPEKEAAVACTSAHQLTVGTILLFAEGALHANLVQDRLSVLAFWIAGTGQEPAKSPQFVHHIAPAFIADHIAHLILDSDALQFLVGLLQVLGEGAVKVADHTLPAQGTLFNLVQLSLQDSRES